MKLGKPTEWHREWREWFAWFPVVMEDGSYRWLEVVERRYGFCAYRYRTKEV